MKIRQPWLIWLVARLGAWFIRFWMRTVRYRFITSDPRIHPYTLTVDDRYLCAFWHENMLFPAGRRWRGRFHVLISLSADGELIAQLAQNLGFATVRGSSSRGSTAAIRSLVRNGQTGHLVVTPDGPRGPRRQLQAGTIYLAAKTGFPIIPVGVGYRRAWRARSWDRFAFPWPGTVAVCVLGTPIFVPAELSKAQLEEFRLLVEAALTEATEAAEVAARGRTSLPAIGTNVRNSKAA